MSIQARSYQRIPTRTVLTAWAACPKGTPAMLMRDRLDVVFEDNEFADLYPKDGRPGLSPGQLALVSVLQFAENLSDRAAANAVRTRIDWKYALGLELDDPGFDHSVLCEFRARLAQDDAADRLLQVMLHRLTEAGLLKSGGRQRTDATHVLAAVRTLSRLELVGESLRAALEQLAQADPDWLLPLVEPEWDKRYGRKIEIGKVPGGKAGVTALAETFGRDGHKVLAAAWAADAPPRLRALAQVEILRQVWVHHYFWDTRGRLRWRDGHALPPASLRFDSPYDTDAHYCVKRDTAWSGYRTHFTETCTSDLPEVVVHVATTIAPVQDGELTAQIHDDLAQVGLIPAEHAVDAAYISPAQIERAHRVHSITLLGPVVPDHSHQAKSGAGFDKAAFAIDWDRCQATCPQGTVSREWRPLHISGHNYIQVKFDKATCLACPVRPQCTKAVSGPRSLALLPTRELHEIQQRNRLDQHTEDWQRRYAIRAGIEATLSQNVRTCGLRRTRYRGLPKTHVQHVLTGLACNVTRITDWIADPAHPRRAPSHFHALCTAVT
ncbi:IS1182 family transposase [Streptomyces sp. NBC_00841]|uniref:IS1182 family transposase n=1 Tax=Streptomyces sp. NBC_00841 TaxID=2975847 RepID=UPI002DD8512C|nr:IS1182 family transposase [Streptomyces sp. NBC_00841]WRZ96631.1 IS1182 family transposase [Streptomyces sp. NBC_00841]WSA03783.1 IS1182 family transposase [Streptomyces sp. NBC_00841]